MHFDGIIHGLYVMKAETNMVAFKFYYAKVLVVCDIYVIFFQNLINGPGRKSKINECADSGLESKNKLKKIKNQTQEILPIHYTSY